MTHPLRWWRDTRQRIRLVCTCGHLPDPPTEDAWRLMKKVARVLVWIQIGKVEVSGREHLSGPAPRLIAPTHGHYLDPFVLGLLVPDPARAMTASGLLRAGGGLCGLLLSSWGAFCTDLDPGKGSPALKSAVRVLTSGQTLLIFPEGWANMDGNVGPFKRGFVSVARISEARGRRPVPIVPVYLRYGTYPGPWIRKLPPLCQYFVLFCGLAMFRRGVRVIVGEPLRSETLPRDAAQAAAAVRRAVLALNPTPLVVGASTELTSEAARQ
jgi:1-acyl-sn-glycerol-3-phosphate acyltransferase